MLPQKNFDYQSVDFSSFQGGSRIADQSKSTQFQQQKVNYRYFFYLLFNIDNRITTDCSFVFAEKGQNQERQEAQEAEDQWYINTIMCVVISKLTI